MKHHAVLSALLIVVLSLIGGLFPSSQADATGPQSGARIGIPSIGVDASVVPVYLRQYDFGATWDVEGLHWNTGHLYGTQWVGEGGNVVIAGHSERAGQPDVFYRLDQVSVGDTITVTTGSQTMSYEVSQIYRISKYDLSPVRRTFSERLTLITCDLGSYNDRLVVIAVPVSTTGLSGPDSSAADSCTLQMRYEVNLRAGPGTEFDRVSILEWNSSHTAAAQHIKTDGMRWWQLAGGGWIRGDLATSRGNCSGLPTTMS